MERIAIEVAEGVAVGSVAVKDDAVWLQTLRERQRPVYGLMILRGPGSPQ